MNTHFNLSCPLMEWYLILVAAATQFEEPSSCIMERWSIKSKKSPINYHYGHFYWNSYRVLLFIWLLSGQSGRAANKNIIQSPGAGGCYPVMVPALVMVHRFLAYNLNFINSIGFMPSNQIGIEWTHASCFMLWMLVNKNIVNKNSVILKCVFFH